MTEWIVIICGITVAFSFLFWRAVLRGYRARAEMAEVEKQWLRIIREVHYANVASLQPFVASGHAAMEAFRAELR